MVRRAALACVLIVLGAAQASGKPSAKPTVKLLAAGSGAKIRLRTHPVADAKRVMVVKMRMAMAIDAGPAMQIPRTELPVMAMTFDVKVVDVDSAGTAKYEMTVTKVDVEPGNADKAVVTAVRASVAKIIGMKGWANVDARNFTLDGGFDVPEGVDAQTKQTIDSLSQSISSLSAPLPDEAVGLGAKWSVVTTMPVNGIVLSQTGVYAISKLDGSHFTAKVTIGQIAEPQQAHPPGMGGAKLNVIAWKGTGSGNIELDLAKELLPVHANVDMKEEAKFSVEAAGSHQDMTMVIEIGMEL